MNNVKPAVRPRIGKIDTPTGIALDTAGDFYVADSCNNRIRKIVTQRP